MTLRIACVLVGLVTFSAFGQTSATVQVRNGKVAYVSGDDLVVKMADGTVRHFVVPKDFKFNIDGKQIGVQDLKVGTELTQTVTTTRQNTEVSSVRNVDVTVRAVMAPYVTVTDAAGETKRYRVPDGTKFHIEGQDRTVFELRPGMRLQGTIVTETPKTVVNERSRVTGTAPPVETPVIVGVLLFEEEQ